MMCKVLSGKGAEVPPTVTLVLRSLINWCWSADPIRPPCDEIFGELASINFDIVPEVDKTAVLAYVDEAMERESQLPPFLGQT